MKPFRFLDLPTELRLMVYERLPRSKLPREIIINAPFDARCNSVKMGVPVALLATCKLVYIEALQIVQRLMNEFIATKTPTIIMDPRLATEDLGLDNLLVESILDCFEHVKSRNLGILTKETIKDK
ncbi:hypothetical protein K491DRAFT_720601 [Lophiostoma macrostomum CBS 122681]|uniref:F-box domain-containing protein n=1 Tax=Lophiostoma macrostomum CBS 122681 TaxID=1314788 RepID=A0A6A6SSJ1_9PLEO|nr:hypothetical protein K491DRAFT_720601 [Lophiostoma macrostomum CBS 122681]